MPDALTISQAFIEAGRVNRQPRELMMLPADWNPALMPERAIVEIKYDGIHAGFRTDQPHLFTREGSEMHCARHLRDELMSIDNTLLAMFGERHVLFGEYLLFEGFEATLSAFRSQLPGRGIIMLFDAVPLSAYSGRHFGLSYAQRRACLSRAMHKLGNHASPSAAQQVGLVKSALFVGEARDRIELIAGEMWEMGHEGIVVKDADSPYIRARSTHWMKIKRRNTLDLPIARAEVVNGRLKAIIVMNGAVEVRVGVGFSERQRATPADFRPGRIVEIHHLGRTAAGSLRSASFHRFRDDKEI